jgi:hypothetical protein
MEVTPADASTSQAADAALSGWRAWSEKLALVAVVASAALLVVIKAVAAPITHDEAITILFYSWHSPLRIWRMEILADANNHLLNTILVGYSHRLLGNAEWVSRLPSIVGFGVAAAAAIAICRRHLELRNLALASAVALLLFQPILLDFFALARGYGLAIAFMLVALWQLQIFLGERPTAKRLLYAQLAASFAVFANFTLLNYYVMQAVIIAAALLLYGHSREEGLRLDRRRQAALFTALLATTMLLALVIYTPLAVLRAGEAFYFGGGSGFWRETVGSLTRDVLYRGGAVSDMATWVVTVLVVGSLVAAALQAWRDRTKLPQLTPTTLYLLLLVGIAGVTIVQHHLFGTPYLVNRTALFLVPLYTLLLLAMFARNVTGRGYAVLPAAALMAALHLGLAYDPQRHVEWAYDRDTPEMLATLARSVVGHAAHANPAWVATGPFVDLAASWRYEPAINYYIDRKALHWLKPATREDIERHADYYYVMVRDQQRFAAWIGNQPDSAGRERQGWSTDAAPPAVEMVARFSEGGVLYRRLRADSK